MPAFGQVLDFRISPDNRNVVYVADQESDNIPELYSVPIGGGTPIRLTLKPSVAVYLYQITQDGSRVIYRAQQDQPGIYELYSVPIAGPASATVKLNAPLVSGGEVLGFEISPDSQRVVYSADQESDNVAELYSVPIGGPASAGIKLNGPLVAGGNVGDLPQISPDSRYVVYYADQDADNVFELYSVPIGGPASAGIKLNAQLAADQSVFEFQISPDSSRVLYSTHQEVARLYAIYTVPSGGPPDAARRLDDPTAAGGSAYDFQISPNSRHVVYRADQDTKGVIELYEADLGYVAYLPLLT
jgi:Tol biopolymer transport system component